jgi:alpha-N-arabinofuranosidase
MKHAELQLDRFFVHDEPIDERLYSAFVEHLGNVIYDGIYAPDHASANENGFRTDVIDLVRDLGLTTIRYPGGNYICSYYWEDTVGPVEERPVRADLAWRAKEPNTVGLAEFETWVDAIQSELTLAVNMSTRGVQDAANVVEYCNLNAGTHYSLMRNRHGHPQPYNVRTWYVGNEPDGPWQIARKKAADYGWEAAEACKAMRRIDPELDLVVAGSSAPSLDTFLEWDRTVLMDAYDYCDMISIHNYLGMSAPEREANPPEFFASARIMDRQITDTIAAVDYVKGIKRSSKTVNLSFDEYNVVPARRFGEHVEHEPWQVGWSRAQIGLNMQHTLLFALAVLTLMRHSDRVKIGCQSILINGIGLVLCEPDSAAWVNATYYVIQHVSRYGRGRVMQQSYTGPMYESSEFGPVQELESVAVYHEDSGEIDLFVVNTSDEEIQLQTTIRGFSGLAPSEHILLHTGDLTSENGREHPDTIAPKVRHGAAVDGDVVTCTVPGYSWNVIRITTT